jgi:hypothetical protein
MRLVPPYVTVGYRQMQQFGELTFATAKTSMYPSMKVPLTYIGRKRFQPIASRGRLPDRPRD